MAYPTVLFVEEDDEAFRDIGLHVEPVLYPHHLHRSRFLRKYIEDVNPHVVALSDRLTDQRQDTRKILEYLRTFYKGPILILTDCIDGRTQAVWIEHGATRCILHPTRRTQRLNDMTDAILDLAGTAAASGEDGWAQ